MNQIKKLNEALKRAINVVVISHVGPDGDTLGSMLAFKEILETYKNIKKMDCLTIGKVPDIYQFLPNIEIAKPSNDHSLYSSYDVAISVDVAAIDRMGDAYEFFKNAKVSVNIDHHISNCEFGDINIVDNKASATGEIIFNIANELGVDISKEMATNLYTAILTDTGGFKFDNTRPETLVIASKLLKTGVIPSEIYKKCYESKPIEMVKLHAYAINNAVLEQNNKIAYTCITRDDLKKLGSSDDHIDGISEILRQINTVEVAIVFKETLKGYTKLSFRSNALDVCCISEFFGGGGHKLAAGCTIEKNINESIMEVLPIVKKQLDKN